MRSKPITNSSGLAATRILTYNYSFLKSLVEYECLIIDVLCVPLRIGLFVFSDQIRLIHWELKSHTGKSTDLELIHHPLHS